MSKSLERVRQALEKAGLAEEILQLSDSTRTAPEAARAVGCALDQIAKSIIFSGAQSGDICLFVTAGGNQVDPDKAAALVGEPLERADAKAVRAATGFAIGGVAPIGHLTPTPTFADPRLLEFDRVWAAAGTPHHVFGVAPAALIELAEAQVADFVR